MANVIDILVSKQAQAELDKVISSLKVTHEEIIKINQQGLKINSGASPKNPQQMNSSVKESIALNEKLNLTSKKLDQTEKQLQQTRLKELQLAKQREQAFDKYEINLKKEEQKLASLSNYYNKTQQQLNLIQQAYNNLATKKERYNNLSSFEENRLKTLQVLTEKYNATLKNVDATIGKHSRNVGNYASRFNPLNNSINQLGREAPAFANNVNTGFMAISNNLPVFFDAMEQVIMQNKELQAQGKPTKSALVQLAGALFSFQTLLSVGVTLLTLYGGEIWKLVTGTTKLAGNFDILGKSLDNYKNNIVEISTNSEQQYNRMNKLISVAKDISKSDEERLGAVKELKSLYPGYLKNLSDEEMALDSNKNQTQNYIKAMRQLKADILERVEAEAKLKKGEETLKLASELEQEVAIRKRFNDKFAELSLKYSSDKKYMEDQRKQLEKISTERAKQLNEDTSFTEKFGKVFIQKTGSQTYIGSYLDSQIVELETKAQQLRSAYADQKDEFQNLLVKTSLLDFKPEKEKEAKSLNALNLELKDYLASQYALLRLQKEMNVESNKQIFDDENQTLSNRLTAYERYVTGKTGLEIDAFNEEKRLLTMSYNNELSSLKERYSDYIKQENVTANQRISAKKELDRAILALDKKTKADFGILEQQHSINILEITKKFYEDQRKLRSLYLNLSENKKFQEMELRDLQQHQLRLKNLNKNTTKDRIEEIDKLNEDAQKELSRKRLQLRVDEINKELDFTEKGSAQELKLRTELYLKLKEISNLESADLEKRKQEVLAYINSVNSALNGFISDFGSDSGFGKIIDVLNGGLDKFKIWNEDLKKFEYNSVATALVVSEAFQQAFNTISEFSNANYQQMFSNLERQRDVSILFAGESATAREEIDRQYEERRKRIQRQQAESQKRLALFNIAINTAQGITSALAMLPPNVPLAVTIGIIGAAQLAMTASQPIPQFYKGTQNAPEGLAWTDEKGAELHTDKNGKIKDLGSSKGARLKKLEKGDKIYTASQSKKMMDLYGFNQDFNNIMLTNGINTSNFNNNSVNLEPLNARLDRLTSVVANKSEVTIVNNESGTRYYERVNGQRRELVNSVLTMKSRTIK